MDFWQPPKNCFLSFIQLNHTLNPPPHLSVFFFSFSRSRYVCCSLSVSISRFLVNLYSASNFSDNNTRSRVASCSGMSLMNRPFLEKTTWFESTLIPALPLCGKEGEKRKNSNAVYFQLDCRLIWDRGEDISQSHQDA